MWNNGIESCFWWNDVIDISHGKRIAEGASEEMALSVLIAAIALSYSRSSKPIPTRNVLSAQKFLVAWNLSKLLSLRPAK